MKRMNPSLTFSTAETDLGSFDSIHCVGSPGSSISRREGARFLPDKQKTRAEGEINFSFPVNSPRVRHLLLLEIGGRK